MRSVLYVLSKEQIEVVIRKRKLKKLKDENTNTTKQKPN